MELNELKKTLDRNEPLRHSYVFWCEDRSMADVYLAQMERAYGLTRCPRATMAEAIREANQPTLLGGGDKLFVVRDDDAFARDERGWKDLSGVSQNVVIGIYTADKRTAFANAVDAVRFNKIGVPVLARMVSKAGGIGPSLAEALAKACDSLYGLCMAECDKIRRLAAVTGVTPDQACRTLFEKGQLGLAKGKDSFQFVNSYVLGDAKGTYSVLADADAMGFLMLMFMQCKSMYLVGANAGSPNICKDTGMTFSQVNAYRHKRHVIRLEALPKVMAWAQRVESGIKLGRIPTDLALRYFLARTWGYASGACV